MRIVFCLSLVALAALPACDCAGPVRDACVRNDDCEVGESCVDDECVAIPDGGFLDGGGNDTGGEVDAGPCGPTCRRCRFDTCVPDLGACTTNDDCPGDSYCDTTLGECLPYGVPPEVTFDPECVREDLLGDITPVEQCAWEGPAAGDVEPRSSWIYTAPMVADLNLDEDPGRLQPSVIVSTWYSSPAGEWGDRIGMLRIFDGRTCAEQLHFGGPDDLSNRPAYGSQWAVADLDGDVGTPGGRPELVGLRRTEVVGDSVPVNLYAIAFDVEGGVPSARRLWYGRDCTTDVPLTFASSTTGSGPMIHDLDDDGVPEILMNSMVFDREGCLLTTPSAANLPLIAAADVDGDGRVELVQGNAISEWDPVTTEWIPETWFVAGRPHYVSGHVAIADLGAYSVLPDQPLPNDLPEVVVVYNGTVRVLALDGALVFGPTTLTPLGGVVDAGGPPTASDFDGDGQIEFAAAAKNFYMVFDIDCLSPGTERPERPGGRCDRSAAMAGMPAGVLWAQPAEETSSGVTGSSIFDFDGNGTGEAVYQDECYIRVYEGGTGEVIFSAPASSGTGYELPTIADVDGDFATEIVVPRTPRGGDVCGTTDPLYPASGTFESRVGFVIYRDPEDRWASSRPIWNQYAYSITHVTDEGTVVRTSEWRRNWATEGLNNFRQNTQGDTGLLNIADLTVVFQDVADICTATLPGELALDARVCNRGTNPVSDGVLLEFVEEGTVLCSTRTTRLLRPGECEELTCSGTVTSVEDLFVRVDPMDEIADCRPGNDEGVAASRLCLE